MVTTTVDALGQDATGEPITPRGNPMTGPFFIEGAEPGDTLVVRLDRLVPNRPTGVTAAVLAPNVVDPEFVRHLPERPLLVWDVDLDQRRSVAAHASARARGAAAAAGADAGLFRRGAGPAARRSPRRPPPSMAATWTTGDFARV